MPSIQHLLSCNHDIDSYAHCLAMIFTSSPDNNSYWVGGWIKLSAEELQHYVSQRDHLYPKVSFQEIRTHFINLIIHKINHHSYGAGLVYELYEERKQAVLRDLFEIAFLSADEVIHIKTKCEYLDDAEPYRELCDCGADIDALQLAKSLHMEGKALCINCLVY
jgi:hypothetical protein